MVQIVHISGDGAGLMGLGVMAMADMGSMVRYADLPTRQKLFFYELCKSGVVVFDLNNQTHLEVLSQMISLVRNKFDEGDYADEPCIVRGGAGEQPYA